MASTSGQPRVWSLWIYDRHCSLLFHADWSTMHNRNQPASTSSSATKGGSSTLSLSEQSKLVYGVVFSLRNMARKFSPLDSSSTNTSNGASSSSTSTSTSSKETFQSFSTSTYTLSHHQTPTNYTFILMTDPVAPPTRRAPPPQSTSISGGLASTSSLPSLSFSSATTSFSGGGGIPSTGGMSTSGVLSQIARGPWIEFVARNAACLALERQDDDEDEDYSDHHLNSTYDLKEAEERKEERRRVKEKDLQKQRMTGLGKSIDSEAFKAAVERVLAQNKLNAPRM